MDEYEPITGELRKAFMANGGIATLDGCIIKEYMTIAKSELDDLCDNIDSVHAQLERENESLRKKVKDQGAQLSEVQGALERRNNGELKRHWQKELDRLKAERDSMAAALDAAQGEHAFAPESHYMLLPKDADGVPIHIGDMMHCTCPSGKYVCGEVSAIGDSKLWLSNVQFSLHPSYMHHYVPDTWERIIMDAVCGGDEDELVARCKRLAGDAS